MGNESTEARVDELSKPGNEAALEKELNKDLDIGLQPHFDPPSGDQEQDQSSDKKDEEESDEDGDLSNKDDKDTKKPKKNADDRFADILSDRNDAKNEAATEKQKGKEKDQRITDLEDENSRLKKGKKGEGDSPPADDSDPFKGKTPEQLVKETTAKVKADLKKDSDAEKSDNDEIDRLITKDSDAEPLKGKIKTVMEKHPTVSAVAAYAMIKGIESGESDDAPSNAKKLGVSGRSKKGLGVEKATKDMTTPQLEKEVRRLYASGELVI